MGAFGAIDLAATGLDMSRFWLDTLSHNMANLNTVRGADEEPFRALLMQVQEGRDSLTRAGGGVEVVGVQEVAGDPQRVYDPGNPLSDEDGYVVRPIVDLSKQMTDMLVATRSYQLNLQMLRANREAYESALRIGRG